MSTIGHKQKLFEASKILDDPVAQMIEIRTQGRPFFFAVARHRSKEAGADASGATAQAKLDKKELHWDFLFEASNIPGFMQIEQFKTLAVLMAF